MRIIAGQWRSRMLLAPQGRTTRPITDRAKASLFDALGARLDRPGSLPAFDVLDLFCGTGSLGLEALSRGARHCVFVERDPSAVSLLRRNIRAFRAEPCCRIEAANAWAMKFEDAAPAGGFHLVFLDPPYADSLDPGADGRVASLLRDLGAGGCVASGGILVLRHSAEVEHGQYVPHAWSVQQIRNAGSMTFTIYDRV